MKWNGKDYRPLVPQKIVFKEEKFDVEEYIKSLAEKFDKIPVWRAIPNPLGVNVSEPSGPPPTPSITPSNTPTVSITASQTMTPTQSNTPSQTGTPTNTPTPSPSSSPTPPPSGTTEANVYLSAVVDAGGTGITPTISAATITLFTSLVSNNLYQKLGAFYPMLGGNSAGCKFNAKNPVDTDGGFRLDFNGGWTFNASGATSNGSNAYADTHFSASTLNINSQHLSVYMSKANVYAGVGKMYIGAATSSFPPRYCAIAQDGSPSFFYGLSSVGNSASPINTNGFIVAASSGATNESIYRNSTRLATDLASRGAIAQAIYIAAFNNTGTPQQFYDNEYTFASIGDGMTEAEVSTFTTIVNTFQTTLNRNTF